MKKVIVIGGGITGLCTAYYLVKEGCKVTVLDQSDGTTGASYINAGYITPSHFIPLAAPGVVRQGLKWMLNSSSPFYIKPRWDTDFFKWAMQFNKSATKTNVNKFSHVLVELHQKSKALFEEIKRSQDFDFHIEKKGILMVYRTLQMEEEEAKVAEQAHQLGLEAMVLNKKELHEIQPSFADDVLGAVHYKCDAHTTPNLFMEQLKAWLVVQGVELLYSQKVEDFETEKSKIRAIKIQNTELEADDFVLATGSWTSKMAACMKLKIPIQGGKGYSLNIYRPTDITLPAILTEARVAITPMQNFTRFAGTMEFSGNNTLVRKERVESIAKAAGLYYKNMEINPQEKESATSGLRPVSPDGIPFIGKSAKFENLSIAAGHAMMGWSLGPITGKLITQQIIGNQTSVNLQPLSPDRFR